MKDFIRIRKLILVLFLYLKGGEFNLKDIEAIRYLEQIPQGSFLTVNIPISRNSYYPVTAMFVGKDKDGRYEFLETGEMIMSKDFLINSDITLEKDFNRSDAQKIHKRIKKEFEKAHKKRNKDIR